MAVTRPARVVLRTERLELAPLDVDEARALVETGRPAGRRRAAGYPLDSTLVAAGMVVTAHAEGRETGPFTGYQIVRRADANIIGDCGFHGPPDERGAVVIGYAIAGSARGHGYATEAVEALIGFALLQHGVRRVTAETTRHNPASRRVLEKAGMRLAGSEEDLLIYEA